MYVYIYAITNKQNIYETRQVPQITFPNINLLAELFSSQIVARCLLLVALLISTQQTPYK